MSHHRKIVPYIRNNRFYNHEHEQPKGFLTHTIYMFLKTKLFQKKASLEQRSLWIKKSSIARRHHHQKPLITWIGHSTFLIQCAGINIITDPVFGNASFLYKRMLPPGIELSDLPPIDIIVLSHNHRDHMDAQSLASLASTHAPSIVVPFGDKAWFDRRSIQNVREYMWWEQSTKAIDHTSATITLTFLPALHWSQRGFFDKNKSLWGSWMIEIEHHDEPQTSRIYFAGDTSYGTHFTAIAQEFSAIDIALLPIGPCEPRAWMHHAHLSAHQAGQAFLDLQAQHFIPMHWGTFPFGTDHFDLPISYFSQWWQENRSRLTEKKLHLPKVGDAIHIF